MLGEWTVFLFILPSLPTPLLTGPHRSYYSSTWTFLNFVESGNKNRNKELWITLNLLSKKVFSCCQLPGQKSHFSWLQPVLQSHLLLFYKFFFWQFIVSSLWLKYSGQMWTHCLHLWRITKSLNWLPDHTVSFFIALYHNSDTSILLIIPFQMSFNSRIFAGSLFPWWIIIYFLRGT